MTVFDLDSIVDVPYILQLVSSSFLKSNCSRFITSGKWHQRHIVIFPLVRASERPCPYGPNKPKVCIRPPLRNLSDGIPAKRSQISKKWKTPKNLVLGCICAHSKKIRISGHGNPTFGTFYVKNTCFSRITFFSEELDRIFFRISNLHLNARFLVPKS